MWGKRKVPENAAKKAMWKAIQSLVRAERLLDDLLADEKAACADVAEEIAEARNRLEEIEMDLFRLRDGLRDHGAADDGNTEEFEEG